MSRTKGSKDKKPRDPEVQRANAKKPRGRRPTSPERELLDQFKADARVVIAGDAKERLFRILTSNTTSDEVFLRAFEMTANRVGLPPVMQQEVAVTGMNREVVVVEGGLGWPGVAGAEVPAAGDGDHDDRCEQPTVQ